MTMIDLFVGGVEGHLWRRSPISPPLPGLVGSSGVARLSGPSPPFELTRDRDDHTLLPSGRAFHTEKRGEYGTDATREPIPAKKLAGRPSARAEWTDHSRSRDHRRL